jgi:hypothetical protein
MPPLAQYPEQNAVSGSLLQADRQSVELGSTEQIGLEKYFYSDQTST